MVKVLLHVKSLAAYAQLVRDNRICEELRMTIKTENIEGGEKVLEILSFPFTHGK